jgi:hypothetical protein
MKDEYDLGREKSGTWPFVDGFIRPQLARVGLELTLIKSADFATVDLLSTKGKILLPGFTTQSGSGVGKLEPFCSNEWKQRVGLRWLSQTIGTGPARMWIGISGDEAGRIRLPVRKWLQLWS